MYKSILQDLFPCSLVCESDTDFVLAQWGNNSRIKFQRSLYPVICHCKSIVSVNQILRKCFALNPYWDFYTCMYIVSYYFFVLTLMLRISKKLNFNQWETSGRLYVCHFSIIQSANLLIACTDSYVRCF